MNNVAHLPASTSFSPEQALHSALQFADNGELKEVIVVGTLDDGSLLVRSSAMARRDALWLAHQLIEYAINGDKS